MNYVDIHNILYPLQRGFRKGLSCNAQLLEFIDYITKNIDEGRKDVQTMQWPNEKMYRQCNDQMKRCTDNVMTKWKDVQTM
jgi:hypothetical protein